MLLNVPYLSEISVQCDSPARTGPGARHHLLEPAPAESGE